jgi:hypothetical protein
MGAGQAEAADARALTRGEPGVDCDDEEVAQ